MNFKKIQENLFRAICDSATGVFNCMNSSENEFILNGRRRIILIAKFHSTEGRVFHEKERIATVY
jgi:hypothetical protein